MLVCWVNLFALQALPFECNSPKVTTAATANTAVAKYLVMTQQSFTVNFSQTDEPIRGKLKSSAE